MPIFRGRPWHKKGILRARSLVKVHGIEQPAFKKKLPPNPKGSHPQQIEASKSPANTLLRDDLERSQTQTRGTGRNGRCSRILPPNWPHTHDRSSKFTFSAERGSHQQLWNVKNKAAWVYSYPSSTRRGKKTHFWVSTSLCFAYKEQMSTRYRRHGSVCHQNAQNIILYETTLA